MEHDPDFRVPEKKTAQLNFNSALGTIALAVILWVGNKTQTTSENVAKIETTLPYVTQSVVDLKTQIGQLVTRAELESRFSELSAKQAVLDARMMKLEYQAKKPNDP